MPRVSDAHLASRRQQIVDAASQLFAEKGFSRTTMADVVTASKLSTGAVYRYFSGKNDLVLAVVAGKDGTIDGRLTDETPVELIVRLAAYIAPGTGAAHARLVAQIWGDAAVTPELATVVCASHERLQRHLADLLQAASHPTSTDDLTAPVRAQVALTALVGLAALIASGVHVNVASFLQTLTPLFDPSNTHAPTG